MGDIEAVENIFMCGQNIFHPLIYTEIWWLLLIITYRPLVVVVYTN